MFYKKRFTVRLTNNVAKMLHELLQKKKKEDKDEGLKTESDVIRTAIIILYKKEFPKSRMNVEITTQYFPGEPW